MRRQEKALPRLSRECRDESRGAGGRWDRNPRGLASPLACDEGRYHAEILDVTAPPATNMVWTGDWPEDYFIDLFPKPQ